MGFIDSYKHLEKLCGEVLNDDRRVSAYIDEMLRTPRGSYYVRTWDEDLKNLKHYRWVRNQISHEPGCTEQNVRALRKILCKKESKQIRKQITNMVFRLENGGIHLPVLAARSMLYDGMRTEGVNNGRRHRAY